MYKKLCCYRVKLVTIREKYDRIND